MHLKAVKVDLKKKPPGKRHFLQIFQSTHQVDMKNVVECYKDFFGYFNALETHSDICCFRNLFNPLCYFNIFFRLESLLFFQTKTQRCEEYLDTLTPLGFNCHLIKTNNRYFRFNILGICTFLWFGD